LPSTPNDQFDIFIGKKRNLAGRTKTFTENRPFWSISWIK